MNILANSDWLQIMAIGQKWLGSETVEDERQLAVALWLEQDYWQKMGIAVANGICKAFNGK